MIWVSLMQLMQGRSEHHLQKPWEATWERGAQTSFRKSPPSLPIMSREGPTTPSPATSRASGDGGVPATPAPTFRVDAPDAPPPNPAATQIPSSTPASSSTPTLRPLADLAEFDPYGTPAPRQPISRGPGIRHEDTEPTGEATEPAFNFSGFLKDLRTKSAEPVTRYLKR